MSKVKRIGDCLTYSSTNLSVDLLDKSGLLDLSLSSSSLQPTMSHYGRKKYNSVVVCCCRPLYFLSLSVFGCRLSGVVVDCWLYLSVEVVCCWLSGVDFLVLTTDSRVVVWCWC